MAIEYLRERFFDGKKMTDVEDRVRRNYQTSK